MHANLQQFISQIVDEVSLDSKTRHELTKELSVHIFEEEKELQLQGYNEKKTFEIISSQFNKDRMVQEFKQVYNQNLHWKWKCLVMLITLFTMNSLMVFFKPLVDGAFAPPLLFRLFGWLGIIMFLGTTGLIFPFNLIFNGLLILIGCSWPRLLNSLKIFSREKAVLLRNYIMGSSLVFHWVALILSFEELYSNRLTQPIAQGGFPFRVFLYPPTIIAEQTSEIQFMPRFILQYVFWFIIAIGLYILLPKRLKENKKIASIVFICGIAATWFGGGYVLSHFID